MLKKSIYALLIAGVGHQAAFAADPPPTQIPAVQDVFGNQDYNPVVEPIRTSEDESEVVQTSQTATCAPTPGCDMIGADPDLCVSSGGCADYSCDDSWCSGLLDSNLTLDCLKGVEAGCWTYSMGGALRYRYLDESNRLRPPLTGRNSDYNQWRFTPYLEAKYGDRFTGYVQAIDAANFGEELPILPIDENRADLLQYYADMKLFGEGKEALRFRVGRQFLKYGSQHLVSPLGWSNTFRNFEGYRLYYTSKSWDIDAFATRPLNGATGNTFRPTNFDTPDQSRWFSGVYMTYKDAPKGAFDLYWLWLDEDEDRADRIDGNRHTFGARYAGAHPINDSCGDKMMTFAWDWEGAFQVGEDIVGAGPAQDVQAGFFSSINRLTFNQVPWSPTVSGIFYWGSGDDDPTDGTQHTVSTLFPLGHAYWGLIDNFSGQNLLDYSVEFSVKPTDKLTCLAAFHWFQKHQAEDAIWNIAGAPFGGVTATGSRYLGNEIDLVATYKLKKNVTLQAGYFWFFYGDAVSEHPNGNVADRGDANQFYFMADWSF